MSVEMSEKAQSSYEAIDRLSRGDLTLKYICCNDKEWGERDLEIVVDYLSIYPNELNGLWLSNDGLTDRIGVKVARFLAVSNTLRTLHLTHNKLGVETFRALARALYTNASVRVLCIYNNNVQPKHGLTSDFIDALRFGPPRPTHSVWILYFNWRNDFMRLKEEADKMEHPTLQELLSKRYLSDDRNFHTIKRLN